MMLIKSKDVIFGCYTEVSSDKIPENEQDKKNKDFFFQINEENTIEDLNFQQQKQ